MSLKSIVFVVALLICLLPASSTTTTAIADRQFRAYLFVEIETTVYRQGVEISDENPSERRWYFSNVVEQPTDVPEYSLKKQQIVPYFTRNVMDPFEARGFSLDFYEQDVRINGESSRMNYETKAEAEAARDKELEYRKNQSGNIYSFELVWGEAKGEETSRPKLTYRDKEQPNHGALK